MKIIIKTKNIKLNESLSQWIEKKLASLEKFSKVFEEKKYFDSFFGKGKPRVEMWLEIGRTTAHHRKGLVFRAEAQLRFPQKSIRVEAVSEDLRQAITEIKYKLQREFKRYKEVSLTKRRTRIREEEK